jgi:transposase
MTLLEPLEQLIPDDYPLKRLNRVLDLSFVHEAVRDRYCQTNGRASVDPEVIVRIFLLQAITGINSVRQLLREIQVNLAYRWFIGYRLNESLPDHSTLSKALDRFGDELFNELFSRSIVACQKSGLIEGKLLHVDATTIRADIDKNKVNKPNSSDSDARFGRFGDGSIQPGYKQQTVVDDEHGVVIALEVTPANTADDPSLLSMIDQAAEQLGQSPEVVCADGSYASGNNAWECEQRQIRLVSPPQPVPQNERGQFTIDQFEYDESRDEFLCPGGQPLRNVGRTGRKSQRRYRGKQRICQRCCLRSQCTDAAVRCLTVSPGHGALVRLRADHQSESFWQLYRRRAPVIEGTFADGKQHHGLRRAWRRGLAKMRIQCLLISTVINLKRLIASLWLIFGWIKPVWTSWKTRRVEIACDQLISATDRPALPQVA